MRNGASSPPRRAVAPRALLAGAAILLVAVGVLFAMFQRGAPPPPQRDAPDREAATPPVASPVERAPAPAERATVPRPVLPQTSSASAAPAERPSARAETKIVVTQIRVQKYVEEAYPAWRKAHPGQECPHQLTELTEYTEDKGTSDAWGRPLRMVCGPSPQSGATHFKVISYGRDGEVSEDDIRFED